MKRKLIKLGTGSLLVSIPTKIVEKYNLKKGQELEIEDNNGTITLKYESTKEIKKYTLDTTKSDYFSPRILKFIYKTGADEIKIIFNKTEIYNAIEKEISSMIGFEIFE